MNNQPSIRFTYFLGFSLILILLGFASYFEIHLKINPCPLCILQRVVMVMLGIVFFFGMILKLKKLGYLLINLLSFVICFCGILLSGRQVWLQHVPKDGLGECGISLTYMFKIFPVTEALQHVWRGGTECSEQGFVFLNLSLAEWSLLWFILFFILLMTQQRRILKTA